MGTNKKIKSAFPDILSDLIANSGKTLREIAKESGVGISQLSAYQSDKNEPNMSSLVKLSAYFDISVDCLAGRPNYTMSKKEKILNARKCTGLSEQAIRWLGEKKVNFPYLMEMINRFFELDGLADMLFFSMYRYCVSQFTTVTMRDSLFDTSEDKPLSESGKILKFYAQEQYSSVLDALRLRYSDYVNGFVDEKIDMLKKSIEQSEKDIADMVQHSGESE